VWSASDELPAANDRHIYTLANNGRSGTEFTWNNLTNAQKSILNSTDSLGKSRLNWIRGDKSNEGTGNGSFRARSSLLGDIINSSPVLVSNQYYGYGDSIFQLKKQTEPQWYMSEQTTVCYMASMLIQEKKNLLIFHRESLQIYHY